MQHHARWRTIWFCPVPGCPVSTPNKEGLVKHLQSKQHTNGVDVLRARALAEEIVNQNCFCPVNQTFAEKLSNTSKRLIRYIALYSMAGVAMSGRIFRIPYSHVDVGFIDACATFLTPKMALSQVRPSGCNLRRVAIEPTPTRAPPERPSASSYQEEDSIVLAMTLSTDLFTPVFQPLRGGTGRTWEAIEYGIATDNASLISADSTAEPDDTDEEIMSFDLGPEPCDQLVQDRLPSDEYLDDIQQGLIPGGSEPRTMMEYEPATDEMPVNRQLLIQTIRQDMEAAMDAQEATPRSCERAPEPSIGFSYDYQTDSPPNIQRIADAPMHSSPFQDAPTLRAHAATALRTPRPRSTSVPPISATVAKMAKCYTPATDDVTPPISPARAEARPASPTPVQHPGRERGRGWWRAQAKRYQVWAPGVRQGRQRQRPRRHRLRVPCGRRSQTGQCKSLG